MMTLYLPRLNRAVLKSCLPTVCRAAIGIRYEKFVAIVAVAVIALNALVFIIPGQHFTWPVFVTWFEVFGMGRKHLHRRPNHSTRDGDAEKQNEICCVDRDFVPVELAEIF